MPLRSGSGSGSGSGRGSVLTGNLLAGRLDLHRDGYGFVRPNRKDPARPAPGKSKIFSSRPTRSATPCRATRSWSTSIRPKPTAAVRPHRSHSGAPQPHRRRHVSLRRSRSRLPAKRRHSLRRAHDPAHRDPSRRGNPCTAAASIPRRIAARCGSVQDTTPRIAFSVRSNSRPTPGGPDGLVVDVEITSWPTPTRPPIGRVIEILGAPDDFGVDVEMMIRKHQLPRIFPENVLAEARAVAHLDPEKSPAAPISAACPSSPSTAKPPATSTTPFSSPIAPMAATSSRSTSPTWPNTFNPTPPSISKPACAAPASISRSRHPHAAAGTLDRHLQPSPSRRPPRPQLHHAARCGRPH